MCLINSCNKPMHLLTTQKLTTTSLRMITLTIALPPSRRVAHETHRYKKEKMSSGTIFIPLYKMYSCTLRWIEIV